MGGHRGGEAGQAQEQSSLELGELEQLTISNDNDLNYDQVMVRILSFHVTRLV